MRAKAPNPTQAKQGRKDETLKLKRGIPNDAVISKVARGTVVKKRLGVNQLREQDSAYVCIELDGGKIYLSLGVHHKQTGIQAQNSINLHVSK